MAIEWELMCGTRKMGEKEEDEWRCAREKKMRGRGQCCCLFIAAESGNVPWLRRGDGAVLRGVLPRTCLSSRVFLISCPCPVRFGDGLLVKKNRFVPQAV